MSPQPTRQRRYLGVLALLVTIVAAALIYVAGNALAIVPRLASSSGSDVPPFFALAQTQTTVATLAAPTMAPSVAVAHVTPSATASAFTGPVQILADGTHIPIAPQNQTAGSAHRSWLTAMVQMDTGSAIVLYRAADGGDALIEVSEHIAQMDSVLHRPDPDPLGMGKLRDVRLVGDYAAPDTTGVRYGISEVIFEGGRLCLQATLSNEGNEGWHIRGWKPITVAECRAARAQIAAGEPGKDVHP